jgi:hypothetical protein
VSGASIFPVKHQRPNQDINAQRKSDRGDVNCYQLISTDNNRHELPSAEIERRYATAKKSFDIK